MPVPRQRTQDGGDDEGQEDRGARKAGKPEFAVEDDRQPHPQNGLKNGRHGCKKERVPGRLPKNLTTEIFEEIIESDEPARIAHELVGEGKPDTEPERVGHKDDNEDESRG